MKPDHPAHIFGTRDERRQHARFTVRISEICRDRTADNADHGIYAGNARGRIFARRNTHGIVSTRVSVTGIGTRTRHVHRI